MIGCISNGQLDNTHNKKDIAAYAKKISIRLINTHAIWTHSGMDVQQVIGVAMKIVNKRVFYFGNVFGLTLGILCVMNIRIVSQEDFLQPGMRFMHSIPTLLFLHQFTHAHVYG